jgi:hypothetical protein
MRVIRGIIGVVLLLAQAEVRAEESSREWYFSWGYNRNYWAPSDIHVSQPGLGNDFTVHDVKGEDFPQFDQIFSTDFSVPQFNFRIGRFISHSIAIELSLEHSKYTSAPDQNARITGTINGESVDRDAQLTDDYFRYLLHNGANHLMINLVKRAPLLGQLNKSFTLSLLLKGGFGILIPHSENTILGQKNDVGPKTLGNSIGWSNGWWQFGGWTTGAEIAFRFMTVRPVYLEISDKIIYSSMSNIPVYQGRADQRVWMNAVIFNLGLAINPNGP